MVQMLACRGGFGFALEAPECGGILGDIIGKKFQREGAIKTRQRESEADSPLTLIALLATNFTGAL